MTRFLSLPIVFGFAILTLVPTTSAQETNSKESPDSNQEQNEELETLFKSSFDSTEELAKCWEVSDKNAWKITESGRLSLFQKKSSYEPPFRSPKHVALVNEILAVDFTLDVRALSTHEDYGHRDVCLFFGYQSSSNFYYVHLGKKTDKHANQIFIVNESARTKISLTTTDGTPWDDKWHNVRVVRDVTNGDIKVYFDDMDTPVMTANDKTFTWGQVGVGSFDDTADFDVLVLKGTKRE